jgi:hypothetical protein
MPLLVGISYRLDLCMWLSGGAMESLTDDFPAANKNCTDRRIGGSMTAPLFGKRQCPLHEKQIVI